MANHGVVLIRVGQSGFLDSRQRPCLKMDWVKLLSGIKNRDSERARCQSEIENLTSSMAFANVEKFIDTCVNRCSNDM